MSRNMRAWTADAVEGDGAPVVRFDVLLRRRPPRRCRGQAEAGSHAYRALTAAAVQHGRVQTIADVDTYQRHRAPFAPPAAPPPPALLPPVSPVGRHRERSGGDGTL
jgi:hypothetical protein